MPSITPKKLLKILQKRGFFVSRQSGSHMILHSRTDPTKRVTLPIHNKDLKPKTLSSVLKQAVIPKEDIFGK